MRFLATCNPGTEDVVAREIVEEVDSAEVEEVGEYRGRIVFRSSGEPWLVAEQIYGLRSIHSASLLLAESEVSPGREGLEEVWRTAYKSGAHLHIPYGATFAVRGERIGEGHSYTSVEIASTVGDAVQRAAEESLGWRPMVRLNSPQVVLHAEVDVSTFRLGVLLTGERSRHRRRYRVYDHPAALKASLAYVMLRLAGARDGDTILDPMCGGGTVAVEAALLFETSRVYCVDLNPRHTRGARLNAESARVGGRVEVYTWDARLLHELLGEDSVDRIVSNPPYGIRLGDPVDVRILYREFMPSAARVLRSGGTAAIITAETKALVAAARSSGLRMAGARRVRHGDLWVDIVVLEKP
ncbi:putative methyltransferase [Aeropyrum pernix]|uniref:Putative methyltransferase n=1 Tax=Aeropyrum pernix TaxID=56636 RepID=A0A401H7X8_AERPX|nr:class I SAM-dependent RNA methyltransferase [Aeropyrum pernix]GBF08521.1 putative methyltransferase [Aeropyrum pernix]